MIMSQQTAECEGKMLKGQRVLVVGTGVSGSSAENFLKRVGAQVICCNSDTKLSKEVEEGVQVLRQSGCVDAGV